MLSTLDDESLVTSRHVVVAIGSSVTALPFVNFDEQVVVDFTGALSLPRVPDHLVVIGGGVIGLEVGSVWLRLGARVVSSGLGVARHLVHPTVARQHDLHTRVDRLATRARPSRERRSHQALRPGSPILLALADWTVN